MEELSIIIVSWNTRELLRQCLASVYETLHGLDFEVWVVDNASSDGSTTMLRDKFPQVNVIENSENLGFARANNLAFPKCRGRYILILNSDTRILPGSIKKMIDFLDCNLQVGVIGPQLLNLDGSLQESYARFPTLISELQLLTGLEWLQKRLGASILDRKNEVSKAVDWVAGAAILARQEIYTIIGGFDVDYFIYSEETDWCWRIWKSGFQVWFLSEAKVIHHGGASTCQQSIQSYVHLYTSKRLFFTKNYRKIQAWTFSLILRSAIAIKIMILRSLKIIRLSRQHTWVDEKLNRESALWKSL